MKVECRSFLSCSSHWRAKLGVVASRPRGTVAVSSAVSSYRTRRSNSRRRSTTGSVVHDDHAPLFAHGRASADRCYSQPSTGMGTARLATPGVAGKVMARMIAVHALDGPPGVEKVMSTSSRASPASGCEKYARRRMQMPLCRKVVTSILAKSKLRSTWSAINHRLRDTTDRRLAPFRRYKPLTSPGGDFTVNANSLASTPIAVECRNKVVSAYLPLNPHRGKVWHL